VRYKSLVKSGEGTTSEQRSELRGLLAVLEESELELKEFLRGSED